MTSFEEYSGPNAPSIEAILAESESEGFIFLRRLIDNWESGSNRFDSAGEILLMAMANGDVVGVGGVNIDPYANDEEVGRIRHVYVSRNHRRRAIGRGLVVRLLEFAKLNFREVRLKTETVEGAVFYSSLGFTAYQETGVNSHFLLLDIPRNK